MLHTRCALIVLLLVSLAGVVHSQYSTGAQLSPSQTFVPQVGIFETLLVPIMMFMLVLAAAVYAGGQIFGAETRARATVWAQGMLAAVGLCAVIIFLLTFALPGILNGTTNLNSNADIGAQLITPLRNLAQVSLGSLIVLFMVLAAVIYAIGQVSGSETRARATGWATALLSGAILGAVIYVVLFQFLAQAGATLGTAFFNGTGLFSYGPIIVSIAFFVACFILITYLLSKVFKVPEWDAYLNIEMSNLMASFLIVVFILGLFFAGDSLARLYTSSSCGTLASCSESQAAIGFMRDTVQYSVNRGMLDVYTIQACTSVLSTFSRRTGEYVLTQTYKVFPGLDTFVSITNVLSVGLVGVYGSISAQLTLLYLVDGTMKTFVLPAGLILRFFPPTRDAGAFLIALAFGFYIIYPTTYLINKQIFTDIGGTVYPSEAGIVDYMCGGSYVAYGFLINQNNFLFSNIPGGTVMGGFLQNLFSESTIQATYMSAFFPLMQNLASLSLLALFMPALSLVITMAFINAMTKFIVSKV
jgi:hypothetical protein